MTRKLVLNVLETPAYLLEPGTMAGEFYLRYPMRAKCSHCGKTQRAQVHVNWQSRHDYHPFYVEGGGR